MLKRQKALEKILDHPHSDDVVKAEAEREIVFLEGLQETYFPELLPPGEKTGERITDDLLDLYATLSRALDAQGKPHPVIRAFAFHLLVCVLIGCKGGAGGVDNMPEKKIPEGAMWLDKLAKSAKSKLADGKCDTEAHRGCVARARITVGRKRDRRTRFDQSPPQVFVMHHARNRVSQRLR